MSGRRVSPADKDKIAEWRELGWSCERIARKLGNISASAVSWHCLKLGADPPHAKPIPPGIKGPAVMKRGDHVVRRFTPAEDERLLALEADQKSIADMCRALGRRSNSIVGRLMTLARHQERAGA